MANRWRSVFIILFCTVAIFVLGEPVAAAPVFSSAELTFDAISPNNDGIQELTEIRYTIAVDSADVRITLVDTDGGAVLEVLQVFTRQGGTRSRIFDGVIGTGALPDGDYEIRILGNGTQGEGQETVPLALTIDRAAPVFTSLDLVSPALPVVQNGQRVTLQACVTGDPQTLAADFSALDSEYTANAVTQTSVGQTCTRFSYTVEPANSFPDRDDLPVVVTARDRAGNVAQETFLFCISNDPPVIVEATLLNQFTVLQNGDQILVEVQVDAVNAVTVGADFSDLDSDFNPEAVLVTPLGGGVFRLAYILAPGNIQPDGEYSLPILAYDVDGCGIDEDTSLKVILDNRGLLPALINDVRLSVPAISPADGNGVNDEVGISFSVIEDTVRVIGSVDYQRAGDERVLNFRLFSEELTRGPQSFVWDGAFPLPFDEIPDQVLPVKLRAISAAKDRQRDVVLDLELDHTPPSFLSFRPPVPGQVANGQRVDFSVVLDRPLYNISADFSALDSEHAGRSVAVSDSGDGSYGISYVVSGNNTLPDGSGKIIPITARDLAGNTITDEGFVRLCLSNQPPRLSSIELLENQGPFKAGSQIVLRTEWVDGRWSAAKPLTIAADFSGVDTAFPDRKDRVSTLVQSTTGGRFVVDIAYKLSTSNDFEQMENAGITVSAADHPDLGCGSTTVANAITVAYDDLDPLRPEFDPAPAVVRLGVINLSGSAEDADLVQILLNDAVLDTLEVDALQRFSGEVALVPGANIFTAYGLDMAGNISKPSAPAEVFFVEGNLFTIPGRFAPGGEFFVALQEEVPRVTVRVFNLEGIEIARLSDGPGDLFRIPWDGKDDTGNLASSGPYIAVADIERAGGGTERLKKAFFFSRRGG